MKNVIIDRTSVLEKKGRDGRPQERTGAADWVYGLEAAGYRVYIVGSALDPDMSSQVPDPDPDMSFQNPDLDPDILPWNPDLDMSFQDPDLNEVLGAWEDTKGIVPAESIYVDANMAKVKQAKARGYHGVFFENQQLAQRKLAGMGVQALQVSRQQDQIFMREALKLAKQAAGLGETPIGCVLVRNEQILSRGKNQRNQMHSVLGHAEILAIEEACQAIGDWRLEDCTMYVTLEPCPMCAGAMLQARLFRLVIGAMNAKAGCAGSVMNMLQMDGLNHRVHVTRGILQAECSAVMTDFFKDMRRTR